MDKYEVQIKQNNSNKHNFHLKHKIPFLHSYVQSGQWGKINDYIAGLVFNKMKTYVLNAMIMRVEYKMTTLKTWYIYETSSILLYDLHTNTIICIRFANR